MMENRTFNQTLGCAILVCGVLVAFAFGYTDTESLNRKATYLEGRVGSHVVLNCPLDFPQDDPIPYVLKWYKDVSVKILCLPTIFRNCTLYFIW